MLMLGIDKILAVFSLGQLQDVITIYRVMSEGDISVEMLSAYLDDQKIKLTEETPMPRETMPACPVCGGKLGLQVITTPQGRANINGWKSLWFCLSDGCDYEEFSMDDVKTAMVKKGRGDV